MRDLFARFVWTGKLLLIHIQYSGFHCQSRKHIYQNPPKIAKENAKSICFLVQCVNILYTLTYLSNAFPIIDGRLFTFHFNTTQYLMDTYFERSLTLDM